MGKSGTLLLLGLGITTIVSYSANAQLVNDPSYSEHNYKHPNKALEIRKKKANRAEIYLQEIKKDNNDGQQKNSLDAQENYKCISAEKSRTKEFTTDSSDSAKPFRTETTLNNNYHQRFPAVRRQPSKRIKDATPSDSIAVKK